jgi:hypothetical protein
MTTRPATIFPLRVTALWAFGEVLDSQEDLAAVSVVLAVDLPVEEVAWLCSPAGAEHWSRATGLSKKPVAPAWRSSRAPLWNHHIRRPLPIWNEHGIWDGTGDHEVDTLSALREATAQSLRLPQPSPEEMASRLEAELACSLRALECAAAGYRDRRFSPGRLEPVADALWHASAGYLDVLGATR